MSPPRRRTLIIVALLLAGSLVVGAGVALSVEKGLPSVEALRDWRPATLTTLYAADGSVLSRIGEEKRLVIPYSRIPKRFLDGIVATEDQHFYHHIGVDPLGIARAVFTNVSSGKLRSQGGSTITQQLARNLFLKPDKTMSRKVQEALLALQIERAYSKEEILTFYSNQVYLGHGRYGVEAAAEFYFARSAKDLSLSQCALLAGIVQSPSSLSPLKHPDRALKRRTHVIERMREEKFISDAEAKAAQAEPLGLAVSTDVGTTGLYFVEEVRRYLVQKYGEEALYEGGLQVDTTLDPAEQSAAEEAVGAGVLEVDKRRGFRPTWKNIGRSASLDGYQDPAWTTAGFEPGREVSGLVTAVTTTAARIRIGSYQVTLDPKSIAWTGRLALTGVMKAGDLVPLRITRRDDAGMRLDAELIPSPAVQSALCAIDPRSGEIRALVGGFDFERSEFDRAIQARRQAGSAFKPFLFSAALDSGLTAAQPLFDEPTVLLDTQTKQPYQPENYYKKYYGLTTMREALEESRNIVSVLLLDQVGYKPVIERARTMGITTHLDPFPSMALGSFEVSLLEMTSAYTVFPNQGIRVEPHFIRRVRDRTGAVLEEAKPEVREVMKPETAFVMTWVLKGVTEEGTAVRAKELGRPIAGKTGTTDDYSDAWFIGFTPSLACGVWVGTDRKETLGKGETGALAALPIWISFFEKVLKDKPVEEFVRPSGVDLVPVDRRTGKLASAETGCDPADVILEAFATGTAPTSYCSPLEHYKLTLPYFLQRFEFNEEHELVATPEEIATLIQSGSGSNPRLVQGGRGLEATGEGGTVTVALALDDGERRTLQRLLASAPPPSELETEGLGPWYGLDGRRATVREIHHD